MSPTPHPSTHTPCGPRHSPGSSPMLYFCCTSRTTCVLADLRKIPSVLRAGKQWGLVSLRALGKCVDPPTRSPSWGSSEGQCGCWYMWNLSQPCLAASLGELGDSAEKEEEGQVLKAPRQGGPVTHLGPAGRRRSPGALVGWAPALGSSPGGCRNEGSERGL